MNTNEDLERFSLYNGLAYNSQIFHYFCQGSNIIFLYSHN
jgi:hypothetical protein